MSQVVDRAYNGLEAFTILKDGYEQGSHLYGLVLTDISMPVMDGFELSQEIRRFHGLNNMPQPMIVAVTGHLEEDFIKKAWACEIDEILPKPVNPEILQALIKDICKFS